MAIFIPKIKPECFNNSYGEKEVYEALRSLDNDHTVFYSLSWVGISENRTLGEADFVILHPLKGILVIEVKSGEIEYKFGEWIQTNTRTRESKRIDPLGQARKSQFEIMERLQKANMGFRLPMMCYCAWFPSIEVKKSATLPPEAVKEILLDKKSLINPEKAIDDCFAYWSKKYRSFVLNEQQFRKVVEVLCPYFRAATTLKSRKKELDAAYVLLTDQQKAILDFLEEQRTAVIHGVAGTGKTVIAIEKAKRLASENESVLFLCFNSYLRDTLRENNPIPNVSFHNAHSLAFEIMGYSNAPIESVLLEFEEYLEEVFDSDSWNYKNIIIDEGQDLDDRLLNRLYELIKRKHGCFYVFYDRNQYIMKKHPPKWIEDAECRLVLHKNCRNTAEVFKTSCSIIGLENVKFNEIHGDVPEAVFYRAQVGLCEIVDKFVKHAVSEGLLPEDVVILSASTIERSWVEKDRLYGGFGLSVSNEPGKVLFTTIRKFKGLEAEAILLVDVPLSGLALPEYRRLLYVGSSRAKNLLKIAMLEDVEAGDVGTLVKEIAPGRNVPKNKRGLKRLLNVNIQ